MKVTDMSERALWQELDRVGSRYRRLVLWTGLMVCWLALAVAGLAALAWARGSGYAIPGVLLVVLLAVPLLFLPMLFRWLRRVRSPLWIARRVERKFPDLDARLLAALEPLPRRRIHDTMMPVRARLRAEPGKVNLMVQYPMTVDRAFAALADPTRRAVLERLGSGSATISELAEPFGMSLTGMKKHIRLLEEAELVTTEKVGRVRRCMLAPYAFEGISTWLQRLDRFAQVVERTKGDR